MREQHPAISGSFFNRALLFGLLGVIAFGFSGLEGSVPAAAAQGLGYFLVGGGIVYLALHGFSIVMFHGATHDPETTEE